MAMREPYDKVWNPPLHSGMDRVLASPFPLGRWGIHVAHGKYETKYETSAAHWTAPQRSVPRYECFCPGRARRVSARGSESGDLPSLFPERTNHQGEDESQDERAEIGSCEGQALGGEDVLEVCDGTLQYAETVESEGVRSARMQAISAR